MVIYIYIHYDKFDVYITSILQRLIDMLKLTSNTHHLIEV